jgi:hypothetical protein
VIWTVVTLYVGSLVYLILTPEGAARLAASISRNVSCWSLRQEGGSGSGSTRAAAGEAEPAGPLLAAPTGQPEEGGSRAKALAAAMMSSSGTSDAAGGARKGEGGLNAHPISDSPERT